jgi:hypothetical protein
MMADIIINTHGCPKGVGLYHLGFCLVFAVLDSTLFTDLGLEAWLASSLWATEAGSSSPSGCDAGEDGREKHGDPSLPSVPRRQ